MLHLPLKGEYAARHRVSGVSSGLMGLEPLSSAPLSFSNREDSTFSSGNFYGNNAPKKMADLRDHLDLNQEGLSEADSQGLRSTQVPQICGQIQPSCFRGSEAQLAFSCVKCSS